MKNPILSVVKVSRTLEPMAGSRPSRSASRCMAAKDRLVIPAQMATPEAINFMATHGRGLICLPLTRERCQQLNLPLMVNRNQAHYRTNFTVSIEAAEGITTGISAYDRAHTIRTAVKPDATPKEVSQPGHVFPLMSAPGVPPVCRRGG